MRPDENPDQQKNWGWLASWLAGWLAGWALGFLFVWVSFGGGDTNSYLDVSPPHPLEKCIVSVLEIQKLNKIA